VLQCVAVCCSVLQCVAVCCSVLQCVAMCCSVLQCVAMCCIVRKRFAYSVRYSYNSLNTRIINTSDAYLGKDFSELEKVFFWNVLQPHNCLHTIVLPIAGRIAQHPEIISKNFQLSTKHTRILMGFINYYLVLIVNPMGRILVRWKRFRNNLEMLCRPICNWL